MYNQFWNLKEKPFENTPDPKFLYHSAQHEEGLSRLLYVVREGKGAGLLTGTYGCGKTLLSRALSRELEKDIYKVALLTNPRLSDTEMLKMILHLLGGTQIPQGKGELLMALEKVFASNARDGKKTVIVVDEAHAIEDPNIFEELRLLLNYQTDSQFLLTLLLLGQDELKEKVMAIKQLDQRIALRFHLSALNAEETAGYVNHRLLIAGTKNEIFDEGALATVFARSGGIPRRINQICDVSLMTAMSRGSKTVTDEIVREAVESIGG